MSRQPDGSAALGRGAATSVPDRETQKRFGRRAVVVGLVLTLVAGLFGWRLTGLQIGRASCRERV